MSKRIFFLVILLQCRFDEASKKAPAKNWSFDGGHPTDAGHELIKTECIKAFKS